jgi:hypothetical protein
LAASPPSPFAGEGDVLHSIGSSLGCGVQQVAAVTAQHVGWWTAQHVRWWGRNGTSDARRFQRYRDIGLSVRP